jgi:hypothetical protein
MFSMSKFYDPILYFFAAGTGFPLLENGIMVWEKLNVAPLPKVLPKDDVPISN